MSIQNTPIRQTTDMLPEAALMQMIAGKMLTQAIHVAARLGIADLIVEKPRGARELAQAVGAQEHALYRLLRALASVGVFAENNGGLFELTPMAELLRSDMPNSLRDLAIFFGEDWHWNSWGQAIYSVKTGKTAFEHVHGVGVFPYMAEHPEAARVFDGAMTNLSSIATPAVVEAYDFSGVKKLVDVAGGHGKLLAGILKAYPQMSGVLFDAPQVIAGAGEQFIKEGVAGRVELMAGDFYETVPAGADCYIMKHIIHDWDDERCLKILNNIHRAMAVGGKLLIVEMVIPPGNEPHFGKLQDLEMLLLPGGLERTEAEFKSLVERARFRLTRIIPTESPLSVVEAVKVK